MGNRKPIFIDRDGVMNVDVAPYVSRPDQVQLFPWTLDALEKLYIKGFDIFVISNQQGVALGITSQEVLDEITETIRDAASNRGFEIKRFYHCTALDSENHPWRKPSPGMIHATRDDYALNLDDAFFIGDKWSDVECAVRAGCRPILVLSGVTGPGEWKDWPYQPERVFPSLKEAVEWIVS